MPSLMRRLAALETGGGANPYEHWTDDELDARLIRVCEDIECLGGPITSDWRELVARRDYRLLLSDASA